MKPGIVLTSPALPGLSLESIGEDDLELIRRWKNEHRHRFFHQEVITPASQHEWYLGYNTRPDDWIFLIRAHDVIAGCAGYRIIDGAADIYNILRAPSFDHRSAANAQGLDLLTNYIAERHGLPIRARVLADNPVHRWSRARGFRIVAQGELQGLAFHFLEQDPLLRKHYPVAVEHVTSPSIRIREAVA